MSLRTDIRDNLIAALKTIEKVRNVEKKFYDFDELNSGQMPFLCAIGGPETRERVRTSEREWDCTWDFDIIGYLSNRDDVETFIQLTTTKVEIDRSRGSNTNDCYVKFRDSIETDEGGFFHLTLAIVYREEQ